MKATVEQLRPAKERDTIVYELAQQQPKMPWTVTKLAEELGPHDFDDVTGDGGPDPLQDPEEVGLQEQAGAVHPRPLTVLHQVHEEEGRGGQRETHDTPGARKLERGKPSEARKFLVAKALEAFPLDLLPDREQALRMRRTLTYKHAEGRH